MGRGTASVSLVNVVIVPALLTVVIGIDLAPFSLETHEVNVSDTTFLIVSFYILFENGRNRVATETR